MKIEISKLLETRKGELKQLIQWCKENNTNDVEATAELEGQIKAYHHVLTMLDNDELIEVKLTDEESEEVDQQKENYMKHGKVIKWEELWKSAHYQDGYCEIYDKIGKPSKMFW